MDVAVEVSVVMPCLNEGASIGACIEKIKDVFSREHINGEIIVSDNGSTDRSREVAHAAGARVVSEPRKGYGAAYLRGLSEVRGSYVVIS
ncbi:MAG: glycosyltransferase, partial [Candidatus Omnitrophica bacterium]|nr:glycosyltransferase [Candidatus Omnitrophota bacterium]